MKDKFLFYRKLKFEHDNNSNSGSNSGYWNPDKFKSEYALVETIRDITKKRQSSKRLLKYVADNNMINYKNNIVPIFKFNLYNLGVNYISPLNKRAGHIVLERLSTDDAVLKYNLFDNNVVALNFGSGRHAGGGYLTGAHAQEEELCRQYPDLYNSLTREKSFYPIEYNQVLYTPNIKRIRKSRADGYEIVKNSNISCSFITAAAPNVNHTKQTFEQIENNVKDNLELIFQISRHKDVLSRNDHNILIVGAWGCGAFAPHDDYKEEYIDKLSKLIIAYCIKYKDLYDTISIPVPDEENYNRFKQNL
jgi:uncharacterized protein (TIGR02452 family)